MVDVLLLLALPASGKSELRRYLDSLPDDERREKYGLGRPVHLDDFPYVHLMRLLSRAATEIGVDPTFFDREGPFIDKRDWLTLTELLNEDFAALSSPYSEDGPAGLWMIDRFCNARAAVGAPVPAWSPSARAELAEAIASESADIRSDLRARTTTPESTIVIEFARGVPSRAICPPLPPLGYRHTLAALADPILERASILYVRVTPEESRRKNRERTVAGEDGSILFHGVPERVMLEEYGGDDFFWLLEDGYVAVDRGNREISVPAAVFDNRGDLTSFLRDDENSWADDDLARLATALEASLRPLRG